MEGREETLRKEDKNQQESGERIRAREREPE